MVHLRARAGSVKTTGETVGLNLAIPLVGDVFLKPLRETGKLLLGKLGHGCFEFLNAHGRKIPGNPDAAIGISERRVLF